MGINFIKTLSNIAKSLGIVFFNGKEYDTLIANGKTIIRPNFNYTLSDDGAYYTVSKRYDEGSVVIPATHLGIPVEYIDEWIGSSDIYDVTIQGDRITVATAAFMDSTISEFRMENGGTISVGGQSFQNCRNLHTIKGCITNVGQYSFQNCESLETIILADTIIAYKCFEGCSSLHTIYFYGSPEEWGSRYVQDGNDAIESADVYYYSYDQPEEDEYRYWHYDVDNNPVVWGYDCLEGHSYEKIVTNPTCTEKGRTTAVCSACKYHYTTYTSAKGHRYGELKVIVPPTCTRKGLKRKTCTTCGAFVDVYTDALGHDLSKGWEIVIPPTETTKGEIVRKCQNAGCDYHENKQVTLEEWKYVNEFIFEEIDGGWEISANGELVGDITIPSSYLDIPVIRIKSEGFAKQKQITGVIIPDSIVYIGAKAFWHCSNLRYLIMDVGVTTIGDNMVSGSVNLSSVYYKGTKEQRARIDTQGLNATLMTLPWFYYSETKPEESGLYWYYNIYHWYDCPAIMWGDTDNFEKVERIEGSGLYDIRVKEGVTLTGTVALPPILDGKRIYGLADDALYRNYTMQAKLTRVVIPSSYQRIGDRAFAYCYNMGTLHVPKSISYVGQGAFAFTNYLTFRLAIYFAHNEHEQGAWSTKWNEYTSPSQMRWSRTFASEYTTSSLDDGTYSVAGTNTLFEEDDIFIADSHGGTDITAIGDYGFMGATASSVAIGPNISTIGKLAFSGTKCQIIRIPLNVTKIKPLAFSNCDNLTIYCEAESQPEEWAADWCDHTPKVVWGCIGCEGDHSYETVVVPPTCTLKGYTLHTCTVCGDSYADSYVPALGHLWAAATCTTPKTCSLCGATEGEALGHTWGDWKEITPAVCEIEGQEERTCSVCGEVETRVIPALIHDYESVVTAPTCGNGGYTTHTCNSCGHTYQDNYTDPTGLHNWGDWTIDLEPTCTSEGSKTCTCKDCGYLESADIPMTDHTPSDWIIDKQPTTEEEGSMHQECTVCGHKFPAVSIPKLEETDKYILTESGEFLTDEEGNKLIIEGE